MKKIDSLTVGFNGATVGILSTDPASRLCTFEYDSEWLAKGFSISPLELPLHSGLFIAKPSPFNGGFGIFEDSLPDGYGRYLLQRTLLREGIDDSSLSILDRLSIVGSGGMGALSYYPVNDFIMGHDVDDFDVLQQKALDVLRERQDSDASLLLYNSGNSGGARPKAVFSDEDGHWLVKFRHIYDPNDIGPQEYLYNQIARQCGIDVPDHRLINGRYFASRRFDIAPDGSRIHTATAGGLLRLSLSTPFLDYSNLLALTGYLTQDPRAVEEMFRRMVFNYLTENKDDHCKNFSFQVFSSSSGVWRWGLAPAYDLTRCSEGYNGQHATSVNGTGSPSIADFVAVGVKNKIQRSRCLALFQQVLDCCRPILHFMPKQ